MAEQSASTVRWCLLLTMLLYTPSVRADECSPSPGLSSCINISAAWWTIGPSRFVTVPDTEALVAGQISAGFGFDFARSPLVLSAAAPNGTGRDVPVVDYALDVQPSLAVGLGRGLLVGVALPFAPAQRGTGLGGITESQGQNTTTSVIRDPRARFSYALQLSERDRDKTRLLHTLKLQVDMTLPFGDRSGFARDQLTLAPAVAYVAAPGRLFASFLTGLRLRSSTELANVRHGSQAWFGFGFGAHVDRARKFSIQAEAWALPSLISQTSATANGGRYLPAEWLGSLRYGFEPGVALKAGFGTGLPVATQRLPEPDGSVEPSSTLGMTAAAWRAILAIELLEQSSK